MEWALILDVDESLEKEAMSCTLDLGLKNNKGSRPCMKRNGSSPICTQSYVPFMSYVLLESKA